jgi:histidyl-tRNA synthetase
LDAEIIGTDEPLADVELLVLAHQLLQELGITEGVTLQINTLGDADTREAWRAALVAHFEARRGDLSEDSLIRLDKNPMRILDSKDPRDRPAADSAPDIDAFLTTEASDFFAKVTAGLDAAGVPWTRNSRLVRGLDYYRHTAFEFVTDRLGAQGAVIAGGRYDGLIEALGGPATSAVGWAAGIERLAMLIKAPAPERPEFVLIPVGAEAEQACVRLIAMFRRKNAYCDMAFRGNLKKRMQRANAAGASYAVIVGEDELAAGEVTVRSLKSGEQARKKIADLEEGPDGGRSYFLRTILDGLDGIGSGQ